MNFAVTLSPRRTYTCYKRGKNSDFILMRSTIFAGASKRLRMLPSPVTLAMAAAPAAEEAGMDTNMPARYVCNY
jgi:hypothetical protein